MAPIRPVEPLILGLRGQKVLLDADLASLHGVPKKRLNEPVKRIAARLKFSKSQPYAFTEHGALMAANVLNGPDAVRMSVHFVRAFIKQRGLIAGPAEILRKLAQIDATLLKHDGALSIIWRELQPLITPPPEPEKPEIGFHVRKL